jgi:hypothetical protein
VDCLLHYRLLVLLELLLGLNILFPLDVDGVLFDLTLMDLRKELSLPVMAHKFSQDAPEHGELRFLPMVDGLDQDALLVLSCLDILPPSPKLLVEVGRGHPHHIIA